MYTKYMINCRPALRTSPPCLLPFPILSLPETLFYNIYLVFPLRTIKKTALLLLCTIKKTVLLLLRTIQKTVPLFLCTIQKTITLFLRIIIKTVPLYLHIHTTLNTIIFLCHIPLHSLSYLLALLFTIHAICIYHFCDTSLISKTPLYPLLCTSPFSLAEWIGVLGPIRFPWLS